MTALRGRRWRREPLVRVAVRLARAYDALPAQRRDASVEQSTWRALQRVDPLRHVLRATSLAHDRGWRAGVPTLQRRLHDALYELREAVQAAETVAYGADSRASNLLVTPSSILAELRALKLEFGELQVDDDVDRHDGVARLGTVRVTTRSVTLRDVPLGRFGLTLDLDRLAAGRFDGRCVNVEALDPNPAAGDDTVTHPHVRDGEVCLGDGTNPFRRALEQGRLCDALQVVAGVLNGYDAGSCYASLEDWDGKTCDDCGSTMASGEDMSCEACGSTLCAECRWACNECGSDFCRSCLHDAPEPDEEDDEEANEDEDDRLFCRSCRDAIVERRRRRAAQREAEALTPTSDETIATAAVAG